MAINLTTKVVPYTDEVFAKESKKSLLTNSDFDWVGAHTIKVYKISTVGMNDYNRFGADDNNWSRYGAVAGLDATTEEMTLKKDRSFTFAIDKLDEDETLQQLAAATALARQQREIVVPEVDKYTYGVMCANAGHKPEAVALTKENIYSEILKASEALDNAEAPEAGRVLLVTPAVYALMKKSPDIVMDTDFSAELRGAQIVKVPAKRLPKNFGFMMAHPVATVAPTKLEDFKCHIDPPGISGSLVEGRICYDAFVLENKAKAIYYQTVPAAVAAASVAKE